MHFIKWILPIIVLAVAVVGFIQLKSSKPQLPPKSAEERAWTVRTEPVQLSSISPQIELYAEVENPKQVNLTAVLGADVARVEAREGAGFKKGDLLIALNTRDIDFQIVQQDAQLASLQAQLEGEKLQYETDQQALKIEEQMVRIAERSLQRQQDLSNRNLGSREQLDTAEISTQQRYLNLLSRRQSIANHPNRVAQLESSIQQAIAQLENSKLDRSRAQVIAPFDGRVSAVAVAVGDRIRSGDLLARIYPDSELEVRAQLPLRILPLIKQGEGKLTSTTGQVVIDGELLNLTLSRLSAEVAEGSAGIDGLFSFTDKDATPEPGRTLSLKLNLPKVDGLVELPPTALYGTDRIYTLEASRLKAIQVEHLGNRTDEQGEPKVLIRAPTLKEGDQIITTQLPNAVTGLLVEAAL